MGRERKYRREEKETSREGDEKRRRRAESSVEDGSRQLNETHEKMIHSIN